MPTRAPLCPLLLVVDELPVDGVGQSSFQAAQRAFLTFACGEFLGVVGTPAGVVTLVAQRDDVQGVVELAVAGPGQPVSFDLAGGHLDRGGAGVGREVMARREAAHIADLAEDHRGRRGPDAFDGGQAGAGRFDRGLEAFVEVFELAVECDEVIEQVDGELAAGLGCDSTGADRGEQCLGFAGGVIRAARGEALDIRCDLSRSAQHLV